jgi:hypothetical protein
MDRDKHVLKRILCRYHRRLSPKSFICMVECLSQELREGLKCKIDEYSLKWMEERNKIMIKEELEGTRNKIGDVSTRLRHMTTELNELKIFFHKLHLESN